eukprot:TRINITY_DN1892_c0_g1_i1.p1 TRINITY_DN1892_c0_g1~~TRINITY_DN1892_c0_g1_i1.p1  ORF type:complete len:366 (+),score=45.87 TRINITY_DN1892_c0_g1_i1:32-1129(+)
MYDKIHHEGTSTAAMDRRLDVLQGRLKSMIELKTGWAEAHLMSRELQRLFRVHDVDATGTMSVDEFSKVLEKNNITDNEAEVESLFSRFDLNDNGLLTFSEFCDGLFGVKKSPLADPQCRAVVERLQIRLRKRAGSSMRGFSRTFRILSRKNPKNMLSKTDLEEGLNRIGCKIDPSEMTVIMTCFDRDGNGEVSLTEFLRAVRGPLNTRRKDMIYKAFQVLDKNADETITLSELADKYDTSKHPDVLSGKATEEDVLNEFKSDWDKDGDGIITLPEWNDYYADISASIDSDDYFELLIRNAWHIPGGEGWCANTSNLRVLVKHTDGSQTVQMIVNDLGIKPTQIGRIKAELIKQGVSNIKSISLT